MKKLQKNKNIKKKSELKRMFIVNIVAMKSLFKLANSSYWQSVAPPIFAFVFSVAFLAIYGPIVGNSAQAYAVAIIGVVAMQITSMAINSLPQIIGEFKTSVLLKRIGSTPIKPWTFLITFGLYYGMMMIVEFFWCIMWIAIFNSWKSDYLNAIFNNINWPGLIVAMFYTVFVSVFVGLFVVSFTKTAGGTQATGMIIFFLSMFLSGQLFPIATIKENAGLNVISYFTPFRYTTGLLVTSWNGGNIFTPWVEYKQGASVIYNQTDMWLNWFIPITFITASIYFSAKNFKWSVR